MTASNIFPEEKHKRVFSQKKLKVKNVSGRNAGGNLSSQKNEDRYR